MTEHFNRSSETRRRKHLRRNMTKAEVLLWSKLQRRQLLGLKFRRQYSINRYVLDFYCPEIRLAVELDGESHYLGDAQEKDRVRDNALERFGVHVLRILNDEVYENLEGVWDAIVRQAERLLSARNPP